MSSPVILHPPLAPSPGAPGLPVFSLAAAVAGALLTVLLQPDPVVVAGLILVTAGGGALEFTVVPRYRHRRAVARQRSESATFSALVDQAVREDRQRLITLSCERLDAGVAKHRVGTSVPDVAIGSVRLGNGAVVSAVSVVGEPGARIHADAPLVVAAQVVRVFGPPRIALMLVAHLASRVTRGTHVEATPDDRVASMLRAPAPPGTADLWIGPGGETAARSPSQCEGAWVPVRAVWS